MEPLHRVRALRDACVWQKVCTDCAGGGKSMVRGGFWSDEDCPSCNGRGGFGPAFFFKQWGGARPGGDALLDGREWREFPR